MSMEDISDIPSLRNMSRYSLLQKLRNYRQANTLSGLSQLPVIENALRGEGGLENLNNDKLMKLYLCTKSKDYLKQVLVNAIFLDEPPALVSSVLSPLIRYSLIQKLRDYRREVTNPRTAQLRIVEDALREKGYGDLTDEKIVNLCICQDIPIQLFQELNKSIFRQEEQPEPALVLPVLPSTEAALALSHELPSALPSALLRHLRKDPPHRQPRCMRCDPAMANYVPPRVVTRSQKRKNMASESPQ
jgi:hypothetical protein